MPDSLDLATVGLRTDTGYRFGSMVPPSSSPWLRYWATLPIATAEASAATRW